LAKIRKAAFPERDQHSKAAEIDKFTDILVLSHNLAFGDATYKINKNRQTKLRRQDNRSKECDFQLCDYTQQELNS